MRCQEPEQSECAAGWTALKKGVAEEGGPGTAAPRMPRRPQASSQAVKLARRQEGATPGQAEPSKRGAAGGLAWYTTALPATPSCAIHSSTSHAVSSRPAEASDDMSALRRSRGCGGSAAC